MKLNIEDEYQKCPELKKYQNEIVKIIDWIKTQPHLPQLSEREVLLFLHACHYHTEITKQTIDLSLTTKTHCPDFFENCDLSRDELQRAMRVVTIFPLEKVTPEGHRVFIGRFADLDATKFNFADAVKLYCMCFTQILNEEHLANGYHIVMDLSGVTLGHVARLGLFTMKKFLFYLQEAAAIRIAGIHYINLVPFMDKILALVKPFLKEEIANVLYLHSSLDTFYKYVPKEILPSEYVGNNESGDMIKEHFYKRLLENREFFIKEEKAKRVNEKLRPGKPKNASDIFGTEGNFKRLDID